MRRDASTHAGFDRATVAAVLARLATRIPARRAALVGVSGLQGSGKSTLSAQIARAARRLGVRAEVLAIDDFYLGRRARGELARAVHALLATRGVPGTHDIALLERTLRALRHATPRRPARIPRFDKGRDTRVPPSRWRRVTRPPQLILLEGWCVGIPPQTPRALIRPLNSLERREDAHARWRTWVNDRLARDYAHLWKRLDALVLLAAPGFSIVERWRGEPERALRRTGAAHAMSASALRRFLMHYERLSRHALRVLPRRADVVIALDASRRVRGIRFADRNGQGTRSTTTAVP
jgi:D-glycerate 3-kinase